MKPKGIDPPSSLPDRADPGSENARLLGPLSKRRHVNIIWRAFTKEKQKTIAPLSVTFKGDLVYEGKQLDVKVGAFQDAKIMEQLRQMSGVTLLRRSLTRREQRALYPRPDPMKKHRLRDGFLTTRSLRRCHRQLMGQIPTLTCNTFDKQVRDDKGSSKAVRGTGYDVALPPGAIHPSLQASPLKCLEIDGTNLLWLKHSQAQSQSTTSNYQEHMFTK